MRLRDLYRTEIYDERRETALSPMLLLCLTSAYIITVVSFDRYQTLRIIPLAAYPIFVGLFSGVSGRDLFRKMTAVMPFVILIGIWNPFFDRIGTEHLGIIISRGWISFFSLMIKFLMITASTLIMVSAAGFDGLCRCAAAAGLPEVLATQLFLLNRYIRLIVEEAHNTLRARVFRGGKITLSNAGNVCGPLLMRSVSRSEKIHNALLCRGFDGALWRGKRDMNRLSRQDIIFGIFWTAYFLVVRFFDISRAIGDLTVRCVI
ncbi:MULTISPECIES: energy-coupling factor transporter transmembrane component T family protein [Synergistaceae]|uniref:energy-coupling factor transporter transmembrane component T family protein n=1 Tax=Synergistaceae TaxID=649777 RepID=UPI003AE750C3|nr:energy-coupling factor transporter transmembrane protein EcfT [Synergistaceae bacterium DZ-S4]